MAGGGKGFFEDGLEEEGGVGARVRDLRRQQPAARPDAVVVVLGLDDSDGDVRLVIQNVVGTFLFPTRMDFPTDVNAPIREAHLLANLRINVPASRHEARRDELGYDVALAECFLVHAAKRMAATFCGGGNVAS